MDSFTLIYNSVCIHSVICNWLVVFLAAVWPLLVV